MLAAALAVPIYEHDEYHVSGRKTIQMPRMTSMYQFANKVTKHLIRFFE
jgi:hypothetical protein